MVRAGGGSGEKQFNRKKVRINTMVQKIKRNQRLQKGTFNVNEANRSQLSAKKQRREQKKLDRKLEKKARNEQIKAEKAAQMQLEENPN